MKVLLDFVYDGHKGSYLKRLMTKNKRTIQQQNINFS